MDRQNKLLLDNISTKIKDLIELYQSIKDYEDMDDSMLLTLADSYECSEEFILFLHKSLAIKIKINETWGKLFFKCIEKGFREKKTIEEIKRTLHYDSRLVSYIFDSDSQNQDIDNNIDDDEEQEIDDSPQQDIKEFLQDENLDKLIDKAKYRWRNNQDKAIQNTILQKYLSGIHHQIMGAGKTYIILKLIDEFHKTMKCSNKVIILGCDKQEVLEKVFFETGKIDQEKVRYWKDNDIIDLEKFQVINCINNKPKKLEYDLSKKPVILVINNDYLKSLDRKKLLEYKDVGLFLLDECHCVSAPNFYKLLKKIKYTHKIPIIGFSATPLRDKADSKLSDIFSPTFEKNGIKKLNIISHYDLLEAISDEIVLPFTTEYVEILKINKRIGKTNKDITMKLFKNILPKLPYKKIIMWCRTINNMKEYYNLFNTNYGSNRFKIYCSSCKDNEISRNGYNCDWRDFARQECNSIMICVNRFREGSDIKNLDCGIFLDGVKKRSILVAMQTGGRIMRPDEAKRKKRAYIIDTYISDESQSNEFFTIQKVIGYYHKLLGLAEGLEDYSEYYKELETLLSRTEIDEKEEKITIKVDDNQKHNCEIKVDFKTNSIDWGKFKEVLKKQIDRECHRERMQVFDSTIQKLKDMNVFEKDCRDFWKVYNNIPKEIKEKNLLPENFKEEYKDVFESRTWYDILGIDTSDWFPNIEMCLQDMKKYKKIDKRLINEQYYHRVCRKVNPMYPPNPLELYRIDGCKDFTAFKK